MTRLGLALSAALLAAAPGAQAQEATEELPAPPGAMLDAPPESAPAEAEAPAPEADPLAPPPEAEPAPEAAEAEALAAEPAPEAPPARETEAGPEGEAAVLAEETPEPWIPQRFGLDALLGVQIGMPLDQAVNVLRLRGFRAQAAQATQLIEGAGEAETEFPRSATGSPPTGLVVTRSLIPTRWGTRDVQTHSTVLLERRIDGVVVRVELSAERVALPSADPWDYGAGRVFGVEVFQDYGEVEGPVNWLGIEAQLRRAAFATPTCEAVAERTSLVWTVEAGAAGQPQPDYEPCAEAVYAAADAASPDAVIAALVAGTPPAVPAVSSLMVQINPAATDGWVWMKRLDAGLQAEAVAATVREALETPPVASSRVEF